MCVSVSSVCVYAFLLYVCMRFFCVCMRFFCVYAFLLWMCMRFFCVCMRFFCVCVFCTTWVEVLTAVLPDVKKQNTENGNFRTEFACSAVQTQGEKKKNPPPKKPVTSGTRISLLLGAWLLWHPKFGFLAPRLSLQLMV